MWSLREGSRELSLVKVKAEGGGDLDRGLSNKWDGWWVE